MLDHDLGCITLGCRISLGFEVEILLNLGADREGVRASEDQKEYEEKCPLHLVRIGICPYRLQRAFGKPANTWGRVLQGLESKVQLEKRLMEDG